MGVTVQNPDQQQGVFRSGSGVPSSSLGNDNDHYINTANWDIYKKASGSWSVVVSQTSVSATALYGDGSDGAVTFNGSSTILGMVPVSNVYTVSRDINATSITVNTGVTLIGNGWGIFCQGTITLNGTAIIHCDGGNATARLTPGTAGGGTGARYGSGSAGANGGAAGASGSNVAAISAPIGGAGGNGGAGTGGSGGSGGVVSTAIFLGARNVLAAQSGVILSGVAAAPFTTARGGTGGGGGGSGVAGSSGSGGGGAGIVGVLAKIIVVGASARISANGGNGMDATASNGGGGGGGGGGIVYLVYNTLTNSGTIQAIGGTAGAISGTGTAAQNGANGTVIQFKNNL